MKTQITTNTLAFNEAIIERTKNSFVECGLALARIKEGKQYKLTHETFEDYCQEKWGWGRQYAYQLITCAELKMSPIGDKIENQGQAKELAKVDPKRRSEVIEKAQKSGKITAQSIHEAAEQSKTIELDRTGYPIPALILADWNRAEQFAEHIRNLSRIKCSIEEGLAGDVVYAELCQNNISEIKNLATSLKRVIPYAVCTSCQGHQRAKCSFCKKRGFISKFAYDHLVPSELKAIREKGKK